MNDVYDPLDYENLAKSIVNELLEKDKEPLPPGTAFQGAGVYAIYYVGPFEAYQPLARKEYPIYVGKAVPEGARKGRRTDMPSRGKELYKRLKEHSGVITQAKNLRLEDFTCSRLVVLPVWIGLAEGFLINHYKPIWNVVIDGFGNHPPGRGRKDMRRPRWDVVHPGRPWAKDLRQVERSEDILDELDKFLIKEGLK